MSPNPERSTPAAPIHRRPIHFRRRPRGRGSGGAGMGRDGGPGAGSSMPSGPKRNATHRKGLEDNVRRTVYICDIYQQASQGGRGRLMRGRLGGLRSSGVCSALFRGAIARPRPIAAGDRGGAGGAL